MTFPHPNRIFGFEGDNAEDVIYVNWLNMVRAGLLALEFYTPEASNWRQVGLVELWGPGREPAVWPRSGFWVQGWVNCTPKADELGLILNSIVAGASAVSLCPSL